MSFCKNLIKIIFLLSFYFTSINFDLYASNSTLSSGNWNTSSIWSSGNVPSAGEDVVIAHDVTIDVNTNNINNLTINNSITLTVGAYTLTVAGNFLLGSDLLIIPKWTENGAIPEGNWRDVSIIGENSKTHKYHPDIKIRPGSIVPLCNNIESTKSFSLDTITLLISLDTNYEAKGTLYSDSGEGFEYLNGDYSYVEFNYDHNNGQPIFDVVTLDGNPLHEKTILNINIINDDEVLSAHIKIYEDLFFK